MNKVNAIDYTLSLDISKHTQKVSYDIFKEIYTKFANSLIRLNDAFVFDSFSLFDIANEEKKIDFLKDKLLNAYKNYIERDLII